MLGQAQCCSSLLTGRKHDVRFYMCIPNGYFYILSTGGSPELCKLDDTFIATAFYNLSFSRWVAEAIFEVEAHERSAVLGDIISRVKIDNHYDLASYNTCIAALFSMGLGFRVIALLLLLFTKRGQQK